MFEIILKRVKKSGIKVLVFVFALLISKFFKLSFVWGSESIFFSSFGFIAPVIGAFLGVPECLSVLFAYKYLPSLFGLKISFITMGLPTFGAMLCWRLEIGDKNFYKKIAEFYLNIFIPLLCMVLFSFNPLVGIGWFYSLYWLIPPFIYGLKLLGFVRNSILSVALRSTFIAHAIGSVIWCYTIPMTPMKWINLIPVVVVERLFFAFSMVLFYRFILALRRIDLRRFTLSAFRSILGFGQSE